jgi:hypothetical protein
VSEFQRLESLDNLPLTIQLQPSWDEKFAAILGATVSFQLRISMNVLPVSSGDPTSELEKGTSNCQQQRKLTFDCRG